MKNRYLFPALILVAAILGSVAIMMVPSVLRGDGGLGVLSATLIASILLAVSSKNFREN
ncbi:MAG: hypothetical protein Q4C74_01765 [Rothia sp. (in: high G+C Gram-positive bacteria)]|nr:hypothetical protein [Rothia sp. (in: high G+C Gram-positive bacteria)]